MIESQELLYLKWPAFFFIADFIDLRPSCFYCSNGKNGEKNIEITVSQFVETRITFVDLNPP
jgi:hypothetical protein